MACASTERTVASAGAARSSARPRVAGRGGAIRAMAIAVAIALSPPCAWPPVAIAQPTSPKSTAPSTPAGPARPGRPAPAPRRDAAAEQVARASAAALKAVQDYRASLDRLLAVYESDLSRATELVEERTAAFARDAASRVDVEEAEILRLTAEQNVAEVRTWIDEADRLQIEATLSDYIARLPALRPGGYQTTEVFVRYSGLVSFGLPEAPKVQRFFLERFGRPLPVSAWGQTAAHDRFGFDHRHAIDVAVHPDSAEGRALAEFLRGAGISFLAFRQAVPGAATGAHFHIGEPSRRLAVPVRR
jgi:hypothetical protein